MYCYILDKYNKRVFEFAEEPSAETKLILNSMGIKYSQTFPYELAGYKDPYNFMEEYEIIKIKADNFVLEVDNNV